MLVLLV